METIKVAAGIVFNKKNSQVLIARRSDNHLWEFPGGKIEQNELPRQALRRELREELNISVKYIEKLIEIYNLSGLINYIITFFTCDIINIDDIKLCVHDEFKWVSLDELSSIEDLCTADKLAVSELLKYRKHFE